MTPEQEASQAKIAARDRTTPADDARAADRATIRHGQVLVQTLRLFDQNPADYRQRLIDAFDAEVESGA